MQTISSTELKQLKYVHAVYNLIIKVAKVRKNLHSFYAEKSIQPFRTVTIQLNSGLSFNFTVKSP